MLINNVWDKLSNPSRENSSNAGQIVKCYIPSMSESEEFIFNNAYCGRLKRFREETQMTAAQMAELLGVPADRYRKYESRSPLPPYLMEKVCRIVGCDLEHLLVGKPRERTKPLIVARKTGTGG